MRGRDGPGAGRFAALLTNPRKPNGRPVQKAYATAREALAAVAMAAAYASCAEAARGVVYRNAAMLHEVEAELGREAVAARCREVMDRHAAREIGERS